MSETSTPQALENFRVLSVGVGAWLIPVVVAIGGWMVTQSISNAELDAEYVALAIDALSKERPEGDVSALESDLALGDWAVDVLQTSSPVPIDDDLATALRQGDVVLAGATLLPPPDDAQETTVEDIGNQVAPEQVAAREELIAAGLGTDGDLPPGCVVVTSSPRSSRLTPGGEAAFSLAEGRLRLTSAVEFGGLVYFQVEDAGWIFIDWLGDEFTESCFDL